MLRRLIRTVRPSLRQDVEGLVRRLVSRRGTRKCLNAVYNHLSPAGQTIFYTSFAKIFREKKPQHVARGEWAVNLRGPWATLPLGGHDTWLDWDLAVSMLGHEPEIKRTYLEILRERPPKLFLDVGANYGLHSLLFLVHGVPTVSFEPNARCHEYFRQLAALNNVPCDLREVALGAEEGWTDLSFPEGETWLGSSNAEVQGELSRTHGRITSIRVPQTTLDSFVKKDGRRPDLVKIDTEGNEEAVLQGARQTLETYRPWVIFESWRNPSRTRLFDFLAERDYRVCPLPLRLPVRSPARGRDDLLGLRETNFIALPSEAVSVQ